ncbi:hypothetical protein CRE_31225 [Caenorhabditis remanei]|uniref:Integrase catalytic domain-containing protein n=1 Tax=Caenorhabditis remanei TaxID=31234 RepID=E3MLP1_CAERE|nr:hypothetical protein CRE_31225 [Caenorhabditis remanei]
MDLLRNFAKTTSARAHRCFIATYRTCYESIVKMVFGSPIIENVETSPMDSDNFQLAIQNHKIGEIILEKKRENLFQSTPDKKTYLMLDGDCPEKNTYTLEIGELATPGGETFASSFGDTSGCKAQDGDRLTTSARIMWETTGIKRFSKYSSVTTSEAENKNRYSRTGNGIRYFTKPEQVKLRNVLARICGTPFERIHLDVIGPMQETKEGNQYIIAAVNAIRCGQSNTKPNKRNICQILDGKYCWKSWNSIAVERFNRTLEEMLACTARKPENFDDWDRKLPVVVHAYNANIHCSSGYAPEKVIFGRRTIAPMDLVLVLTDVKSMANHKSNYFHKYGVKSPNQTMFDILPGNVLATGCATGIMMQSAQFDVDNCKNHSEKLREACRKAKSPSSSFAAHPLFPFSLLHSLSFSCVSRRAALFFSFLWVGHVEIDQFLYMEVLLK